ncbi:septation ring formation regulator [Granulicatella balaenopterae]|uniref:Septation ring formation regulator EzrA n=1 Tax=Granulicatella balaenopterae TaxID=137733 RepID=A0A1H9K2V5_9LACT|nr:septation ring formation regulator EzrA [Granulicatella balaenopterae]SEQ93253.1 septation ring formation regulator [Granulicatella balaenopterae]
MEVVYFFLTVVVIGLIIYGAIYYFSHQQTKEIEEINQKKQKLMGVPIADTLYTLKNLSLTGQTKRSYESWQASWQTITRFRFPEIEATIVAAEQYITKYNFVKAKQTIKEANELIDETKKDVDKVYSALQKLLESEKQNRAEQEALQERYTALRKELLAHSVIFGDALESLEKRLSYLELDFTKFNTLTNEGDHLEAKEVLTRIQHEMDEFEHIIEEVPKLLKELETELDEEILDLQDGYTRMVEENYPFGKTDVAGKIRDVMAIVEKARKLVITTDLEDARQQMDKASREIETLYSIMEAELAAKQYVVANQKTIAMQLKRIIDANRYVSIEIDRVSQNYILSHNETAQVNEFEAQLTREQESLNHYTEEMENATVPFTTVEEYYHLIMNKLQEIDGKQRALVAELADLKNQERQVRDNLDDYELSLRNMKRTIEKYHLPGLPKEYLQMFFATTNKIEQLAQHFNRVKIDMREINQIDAKIKDDIEQLEDETQSIIDNARLTEYMIQHANRYRLSNPEIEQAINSALEQFNSHFYYAEALRTIETALNAVEPEAGKRVRNAYAYDKNNQLF